MSGANIAFELENMNPFAAGAVNVRSIITSEDGILLAYGTTVPTYNTSGYARGCLFFHVDGEPADMLLSNYGCSEGCNFLAVTITT